MITNVSYTDLPPHTPYFKVLEEEGAIELVTSAAATFGHVATQIHIAAKADEPLIEIVAVTKRKITSDEARTISQEAVDFLFEQGKLPHQ